MTCLNANISNSINLKNEKKAKEREKREIEGNNRRHLANVRVVQKNLVYVIGLPNNLASDDVSTLRSHDYFGQFGRINKIVINRRQNGGGSSSNAQHPSVGVYVTYATKEEATRAINAVDGSLLDGRVLRATFGTTKYCSYYLRNISCQNPGCMYLHEPGEEADSFTKEDLAANRAELRDVPREAFDHDDDYPTGRAISQSPTTHQGTGRATAAALSSSTAAAASVSSLPGFQNSRPQSTVSTAAAAAAVPNSSLSVSAANAATRLRKASELSGTRPKSVEPYGNDGDGATGSALPATASWATRAMAKKPVNEPSEPKSRRPESGGTMTLRMIPASRNKTAAAATSTATAKPGATVPAAAAASAAVASVPNTSPTTPSASSTTTRERAKTAAATTTAITATSDAAAAIGSAAAGIPHHPALQQLNRERKQQQRQQTRAQQKQTKHIDAENIDGDGETETDVDAEPGKKRKSASTQQPVAVLKSTSAEKSDTSPVENSFQLSRESGKVASTAADTAATSATLVSALSNEIAPEPPASEASTKSAPVQPQAETLGTADQPNDSGDAVVPEEAFALEGEGQEEPNTAGYDAVHGANHTNSAATFQSITDSLFAQLNAKVSTPPTSNFQAFSGPGSGVAAGFDGHSGLPRNSAGYPAAADSLLFPPPLGLAGNAVPTSGYGRMDSAPQFNMFGGQPNNAQWGRLGVVPGGYAPTSLSSMLAGPPPLGSLGEAPPPSGGLGAFSRQRSRWDFVHADEVSAQAELQSVLGRGPSDKGLHSQQQQGPPGSFMSSRDLGMFSTPVQNEYSGGPWGNRQQGDAYTAPHPPPGFGGRQRSDLLRAAESGTQSMLGSGTPPSGSSNTLLSRLMGQASNAHDISGANAEPSLPLSHYPQAQQQQQQFHGYQDPAVPSSFTAPAGMNSMQAMASNASLGNVQQEARGRGDPNVLNSLLARLHLGQGEGASPLAPMGNNSQPGPASMPFMSQPMGHRGSIGAGGMAPPGMGVAGSPVFNNSGSSSSSNAPGQNRMSLSGIHSVNSGGFVDPAIMNMGRVSVSGGGGGPTSPVGLPPGILSPQATDSSGSRHGAQMQHAMVSRSANSSGRSRFLNHFSPDGMPISGPGNASQQGAAAHPDGGSTQSPASEGEPEAGMVNGVPPGLPTTGLFGELLRRVKLETASASAAGASGASASAPHPTSSGSTYVSGKMMLGDIERKLDAARREARDLQAQLSTVIGQNQSAMWALANGGTSA
ncbi:transcriptional repressor general negative regulator of transcription subunit 4 [Coemansia sp. BCRC 34301]|nr:transcriptional repressor general negative regulator of transcription subunit 4 [Coemansia sp. BCRC 34301]